MRYDPEHLPTEQYEAQLAEKSGALAEYDGAVFASFRKYFARRSVIVCVRNFARGMTAMTYHIAFDQQTKSRFALTPSRRPAN